MFGALLKRAQVTVDNAIGLAFNRLFVATPFVLAAGFAISGLYVRMERIYGAEISLYILAGVSLLLGITAAIVFRSRPPSTVTDNPAAVPQSELGVKPPVDQAPLSKADRELMMAALASAAPVALPAIWRGVLRNLPLLAVMLAAIFIMMAPTEPAPETAEADAEAA